MAGGRRNAIVAFPGIDDDQDIVDGDRGNDSIANRGSHLPQKRRPRERSVIEVSKGESPEPQNAGSRVSPFSAEVYLKPSGIPRPSKILSGTSGKLPPPLLRADAAAPAGLLGEAARLRAMSMDPTTHQTRSWSHKPGAHPRSGSKIETPAFRARSLAIGTSSKTRVGSWFSTSGQQSGEDRIWYEVGTPSPSPQKKPPNTVEKHKEAFQSSLARGSTVVIADGESHIPSEVAQHAKVKEVIADLD